MFSSIFHKDALFVTLILSHIVLIFSCVQQVADSNGEFFLKSSELFESPVYLEEVADVLCILQAGQWCKILMWSLSKTLFDKLVKKTPLNYSDNL